MVLIEDGRFLLQRAGYTQYSMYTQLGVDIGKTNADISMPVCFVSVLYRLCKYWKIRHTGEKKSILYVYVHVHV